MPIPIAESETRRPEDFAFRLNNDEWDNLKSRIVISKGSGGRLKLPYVFTEQGVAMLSSVLHSKQAVSVNVEIMRTFVRLRNLVSTYKQLEDRIRQVEKKSSANYQLVLQALLQLKEQIEPSLPANRRKIGIQIDSDKKKKTDRKSRTPEASI